MGCTCMLFGMIKKTNLCRCRAVGAEDHKMETVVNNVLTGMEKDEGRRLTRQIIHFFARSHKGSPEQIAKLQ